MLIDWFTVGAQAANFLILVWLLKRYLYQPVLSVIDAREKTIAARIADAAAQAIKAAVAADELRKRNEVFDRDRDELMRKVVDDVTAERRRLSESARQESQLLRSKLTQTLAAERAELGRRLSTRTQAGVFSIARKALSDLAGVSLESRVIEVFLARLADAKFNTIPTAPLMNALPARVAVVRSAFEPSIAARARIESAVAERLGAGIAVRYETSADLICGIELTVDDIKLAWSVSNYLSALAQDVAALATTESAAIPSPPGVSRETVDAH